jgi:hypothetical protein
MTGRQKKAGQPGPAWQPSRPGGDHGRGKGTGSGDRPGTGPAGDGDGGGKTDSTAALLDKLRDAAAGHDRDYDLLPRTQDGAVSGEQPER